MGQVEQVFSHAVNLLIPEQQRLLTLLSEDCDDAPNSRRLALTHYEDPSYLGEQVNFSGSGTTVGNDKWIEITGCQMWWIPRWTSDSASLAKIGWQHQEEFIRQQLRSNDTSSLYQGDNPFYQEISRQLPNRRRNLLKTLCIGENITAAVNQLIGLGIGLAPSSDDYLVGLSTILFIQGHPLRKYRYDFLATLQLAGNNITLFSKITLEEAFDQRYQERVGRLLNQFTTEPQPISTQYVTDIKNIGSSPGCDMLYDTADAYALSHRSRGNYVNQDSCKKKHVS